MIHTLSYASPLGPLWLAEQDGALRGLWFRGQKYEGGSLFSQPPAVNSPPPLLTETARWLDEYFAGKNPDVSALPLAPAGSDFRQAVWQLLREIPYGQTTTYGALAAELARRTGRAKFSAQAVGGAVGHNPLSLLIPCHRVLGQGGLLTGYAGGLNKKAWLLTHEGASFTPPPLL